MITKKRKSLTVEKNLPVNESPRSSERRWEHEDEERKEEEIIIKSLKLRNEKNTFDDFDPPHFFFSLSLYFYFLFTAPRYWDGEKYFFSHHCKIEKDLLCHKFSTFRAVCRHWFNEMKRCSQLPALFIVCRTASSSPSHWRISEMEE